MSKLKVAIGSNATPEVAARLAADEALDVTYDADLYIPWRYAGNWPRPTDAPQRTPEQQKRFMSQLREAEVIFGLPDESATLLHEVVDGNDNLRWLHTMAAGGGGQVRGAKLSDEQLNQITFTTSAGAHAEELAEFAVFGALAGAKDLPRSQADQRNHVWGGRWLPRHLHELTVVIVAMGEIGRACVRVFDALGTKRIIGVNRSPFELPGVEAHTVDSLLTAAAEADVLINCLPAAVGTEKLISAEVLAATKPGCVIVSVGRGTCIDEDALIVGLKNGHLGYAALDVVAHEPLDPASELWDLPNVLITPHNMALSLRQPEQVIDLFLENAHAYIEGRPMRNVMNKQLFY
ncbi:MAG: D-2-hydroxyacid dehydrogenase [Propionibacteriaceae bacterium]|jgi:phosphoglycerate dehydrogenase-like enzyme|nr:D-2-hydroxyacid dehydrogenase [Propionibacteriaceae bacterium]